MEMQIFTMEEYQVRQTLAQKVTEIMVESILQQQI